MYIFGTSYFVTPLLSASVHAGIEVCVVEDDRVCIKHRPDCRAASVGQDAAEHLPVPVKLLHALLQGNDIDDLNPLPQSQDMHLINILVCISFPLKKKKIISLIFMEYLNPLRPIQVLTSAVR